MRSKRALVVVALLAVAVLGAVLWWRCRPKRYVAQTRLLPAEVALPHEGDLPELDAVLEAARVDAEAGGLLDGIHETLHLLLDGRVAYTVAIDGGRAVVTKGIASGTAPTLVVPVTAEALGNLREEVSDGKLTDAEIFNVAHVLLVPCLRRIHGMFYFQGEGDKTLLGVDDFMHFKLANPEGFTYHGETVDVAATVLNVDGWFFHLRGLVGDPDVRYEFTLPQALELYRLVVYEAGAHRDDTVELLRVGREARRLLDEAIVYERTWH